MMGMNQNSKKTNVASKSILHRAQWMWILFVTSLATMAVHGYLTLQHFQLKLGFWDGKSVCNISTTFNCDSVAISSYATLFGIPMALLGFLAQLVFFILLLSVQFNLSTTTETLRRFLLWISIFIFGTSVVMALISTFGLGTYCLFCMAAYALSILQLISTWKTQETSLIPHFSEDLQTLLSQARWALILFVLIPAFGWMGNSVMLSSYGFGRIQVAIQDALATWESSPVIEFNQERGLVLQRGAVPAKLVIVEFADFLCPHCKVASPSLEAFTHSHPDVKLVFKTFPLDGKCNKAIQQPGNGLRCQLSAAMVCAESLGKKGWDAHHWIFARQESMHGASFEKLQEEMSQELKLDAAAFKSCLNSDATQETLLAMAEEGKSISGTPTVFVNGKLLPRGQVLPVLEALYKKLNP